MWAFLIVVPSLVVWGFGIPLFALFLLIKEKNKLDTVETKQKYGFLFRGYKKRYFYWEIVIMYRKLSLIIITVVVQRLGILT